MVDLVNIGKRIKEQRELWGYTREELAELADITPRFCYDLELGLKGMSLDTLCKLTSALHVSADYLLYGKSDSASEFNYIQHLLDSCPEDKRKYLIQIITSYVNALKG